MLKKGLYLAGVLASLSLFTTVFAKSEALAKTSTAYLKKDQHITAFINQLTKKYHFKKSALNKTFAQTQYYPKVIQLMNRPFEKKPWSFYRNFFVTPSRIDKGVAYWKAHAKTLAAVQKRYGVDPSIIVAIIGIETRYGERKGTYQEIGALSTLAFDYPKRARFFKKELLNYLLLTRKQHLSTLGLKGSYAGALGIPQFMPSSYRHYGVSFVKGKSVDLLNNNADAIASVANYLQKEGWKKGEPIASPAIVTRHIRKKWISVKSKPNTTINQLAKRGIYPTTKANSRLKAAITDMKSENSQEYWITYPNFTAIMRYNHSVNYAMAAYQLSHEIKEVYLQQPDE